MAETDPKLPMTGKDAKLTLFEGGAPVPEVSDLALKWTLKPKTTKFADPYLGRNRKRFDKQVDGFDLETELHVASMSVVNFLVERQRKRDAKETLPELSVGLRFAHRDGQFSGLVVRKCVEDWELNCPGQAERKVNKLMFEGEDVEPVTL